MTKKKTNLPPQGGRIPSDRRGGVPVPGSPSSLSYDGRTSGCDAGPEAENASADLRTARGSLPPGSPSSDSGGSERSRRCTRADVQRARKGKRRSPRDSSIRAPGSRRQGSPVVALTPLSVSPALSSAGSGAPSMAGSAPPSTAPSAAPSRAPSAAPSRAPSAAPSCAGSERGEHSASEEAGSTASLESRGRGRPISTGIGAEIAAAKEARRIQRAAEEEAAIVGDMADPSVTAPPPSRAAAKMRDPAEIRAELRGCGPVELGSHVERMLEEADKGVAASSNMHGAVKKRCRDALHAARVALELILQGEVDRLIGASTSTAPTIGPTTAELRALREESSRKDAELLELRARLELERERRCTAGRAAEASRREARRDGGPSLGRKRRRMPSDDSDEPAPSPPPGMARRDPEWFPSGDEARARTPSPRPAAPFPPPPPPAPEESVEGVVRRVLGDLLLPLSREVAALRAAVRAARAPPPPSPPRPPPPASAVPPPAPAPMGTGRSEGGGKKKKKQKKKGGKTSTGPPARVAVSQPSPTPAPLPAPRPAVQVWAVPPAATQPLPARPAAPPADTWATVASRRRRGPQPVAAAAAAAPAQARPPRARSARRGPAPPSRPPARPAARGPRRRRVPTTAAVVLHCPEGTYAATLQKARERVKLADLGISEVRPRRALTGALVLEVAGERRVEAADALAAAMRQALGDVADLRITRPQATAEIRLRDLEPSLTAAEIAEAVARAGGCAPEAVAAGERRASGPGLGQALVRCPVAAANALARAGHIVIGWTRVRVALVEPRPLHCFKCLARGHCRAQCPSPEDRSGLCRRCGQAGHIARDCTAAVAHCAVCSAVGRPAAHRAGGRACPLPSRRSRRTNQPAASAAPALAPASPPSGGAIPAAVSTAAAPAPAPAPPAEATDAPMPSVAKRAAQGPPEVEEEESAPRGGRVKPCPLSKRARRSASASASARTVSPGGGPTKP